MWFVVCLLFLFAFFFFYDRKKHRYWENLGVPCLQSDFLFGTIKNYALGKRCLGLTYCDIYKSFPNEKFVGVYEFYGPRLLIVDPEFANRVLVTDFGYFTDRNAEPKSRHRLLHHVALLNGQKWKAVRSKLNHAFSTAQMKLMYESVIGCTKLLESNVKGYSTANQPIDVKEVMAKFTTDVIGSCVFGMEFNSLADPESPFRKIGTKIADKSPRATAVALLRMLCPALIHRLKLAQMSTEVEPFFFDFLRRTEEFRKNEPNRRNDFLQLILDIRSRELTECEEEKEVLFDENVLASNIFVFFSAGFETTSTTLACCLLELALNQPIQEKLRVEIKKESDLFGGTIPYAQLQKLPYLEMVISETLRKHNPAFVINRMCVKEYQIPGTSSVLKPGVGVIIPIHGFHHDERFFPDPEKFDPERFSQQNEHKIKPYTYLPFGNGLRICIALKFAKLEIKCCLSALLLKYRFDRCDKTEERIKVHPRSSLNSPASSIYLQVTDIRV